MISNRLLVENLDHLTTKEHLENIFSTYGDVNKVIMRKDRSFVEMMSVSEARRARNNLDGSILWGRSMKIHALNDTLRNRMIYLLSRFLG